MYAFFLSLFLTTIYVYKWHKHFEVNISLIFTIIPIANLGYLMEMTAKTKEGFIYGTKIEYIGGCFLILFINLCVFRLCGINIRRWIRTVFFVLTMILFLSVLSIGYYPIFYKGLSFEKVGNETVVIKDYAIMHNVFYGVLILVIALGIGAIIYTYVAEKPVSKTMLFLLAVPELLSIAGFLGNKMFFKSNYILPYLYVTAQLIYLLIIKRMALYDIIDTVIESMAETGQTAFISIDMKHRYLGSNETAKNIIPELRSMGIDKKIDDNKYFKRNISHWLKHFEEDNSVNTNLYIKRNIKNLDEVTFYKVEVDYLYYGSKKKGYQIILRDDTKNQEYINLLDNYNTQLEEEVSKKTEKIVEMHNNLILSMAVVVESRDNSTGGHVRRTSDVVKMLIEEIKKNDRFGLTDEFCKDLIKAAPMHDLGKIAVDDAVLKKPGRFTDEEFEKMKTHAAEGAKIVHEILKDTDDESFKIVAENVAHYHHERMDGSGYPEGLKGEEIPIEARIMAVADVYDALVSKRVYKESMSFEQANKIMMESMGSHFDKNLEEYYVNARPKLEEYYSNQE